MAIIRPPIGKSQTETRLSMVSKKVFPKIFTHFAKSHPEPDKALGIPTIKQLNPVINTDL